MNVLLFMAKIVVSLRFQMLWSWNYTSLWKSDIFVYAALPYTYTLRRSENQISLSNWCSITPRFRIQVFWGSKYDLIRNSKKWTTDEQLLKSSEYIRNGNGDVLWRQVYEVEQWGLSRSDVDQQNHCWVSKNVCTLHYRANAKIIPDQQRVQLLVQRWLSSF